MEFEYEVRPCFHVFAECFGKIVWLDMETACGDPGAVFGWLVCFGGVFDYCLNIGEFDVVETGGRVFPKRGCLRLCGE